MLDPAYIPPHLRSPESDIQVRQTNQFVKDNTQVLADNAISEIVLFFMAQKNTNVKLLLHSLTATCPACGQTNPLRLEIDMPVNKVTGKKPDPEYLIWKVVCQNYECARTPGFRKSLREALAAWYTT